MSDERENDLTHELAEMTTQEIKLLWNNLRKHNKLCEK